MKNTTKITAILAAASVLTAAGCGRKVSTAESEAATMTSPSISTSTEASSVSSTTKTEVSTTETTVSETTEPTTSAPEPPEDLVLKCRESVEVYDELTLDGLITEKNAELLEPSAAVDTSSLGAHEVSVGYKDAKGNEFEKKLSYNVVDTTAPLLLNAGWSPTHIRGTAFDLGEYVGFADNYDREPVLTYTGDIDPNTNGNYPLKASATDSSGNTTSWDITITVADSKPNSPDNNPRFQFADFRERYAGEGRHFGIDVSTWQGDVDFNAVKEAGAEFVFIRIGYYYSHIVKDDWFEANLKKAKEAGLKVGLYLYTTDNTEEGAREHARWIAEQLGGTELELPIAFDWEEFGNFQQYKMSIRDLNNIYLAFADEIEKQGYTSMLYSSRNFLNNFWNAKSKAANPVWLAHFVDETNYEGKYWIWQASCFGKIPGIAGDVDMNVMYGDN